MPNRATLIRSLLALQSEKRTGVLTVSTGDTNLAVGVGARLVLCLRGGALIFATETTPQKSLGRRLVQHGLLTEPLFARIMAKVPKTFGFDEPVRFCETAVSLGILTERSVSKVLDDEAKQTVMRSFAPATVDWAFEDAALEYLMAMVDVVRRPTPVNVEAVIHEAMRKLPMAQKLEAVEKVIDASPIVVMGSASDISSRFELSPIETKVVEALCQATEPPRAILDRIKDPSLDPFGLLAALTVTRVVRDAIAPASSRRMPAVSAPVVSFGPPTPASPMMVGSTTPSSSRMHAAAAVIVREEPPSAARLEKKTLREPFEPVTLTPPASPPKSDRISLLVPDPPASSRSPSASPLSRVPSSGPVATTAQTAPTVGPSISNRPTIRNPNPTPSQMPVMRTTTTMSSSSNPAAPPPRSSVTPRIPSPSPASGPGLSNRPTTDPFVPKARASDVQMASRSGAPPAQRRTPPPNAREAAVIGEKILAGAIEYVKVGRWAQAHTELTRASELMPDSDKVDLFLKWTAIQLRPNAAATKNERVDLARSASASLKADPDFAFAYYVVGDLSLNDDDVIQAHRLLSKAVKLDPTLLDAARLLRVVERRTNSGAKGLLGKK